MLKERFKFIYPLLAVFLLLEVVMLAFYLGSESEAARADLVSPNSAGEKVLELSTELRIKRDRKVHVLEKIKVRSEGQQIKTGIYRAYPQKTTDSSEEAQALSYRFLKIELDGKELPIDHSTHDGYEILKIRDPQLIPGDHNFLVEYEVEGAVFLGDQYDELRFAQSGVWAFPVLSSVALVHLPPFMLTESVIPNAYSGTYQNKKSDFSVKKIDQEGSVLYQMRKALLPGQYFELRMRMPKGFLHGSLAPTTAGNAT